MRTIACRRGSWPMIAGIFEFCPANEREGEYLDLAARLRDELSLIDGFVSVERFQSLTDPGKFLSLSFWRDEAAVAAWRNHAKHRTVQAAGRGGVFRDYRLRGAAVMRDYGLLDRREQAPQDSRLRRRLNGDCGAIRRDRNTGGRRIGAGFCLLRSCKRQRRGCINFRLPADILLEFRRLICVTREKG
jgi:heme-degrading monooxygenase HmoA